VSRDTVIWIASPLLILIIWELICRLSFVPTFILPAPSEIFQALLRLFVSGKIWPHIYASLFRAIMGFVLGSAAGIALGILMGWSRLAANIADIPFNFLRAIPKAAMVPVFIVWFGIGEFPKILMVALTSFVMCTVNTISGVRNVDINMVKAARSLGAKDREILSEIVFPATLPSIFAALRLGVVVSLVLLVIVEMTAAKYGLGTFIMESEQFFYVDDMFAGITILALLGYMADLGIRKLSDRALRWHKGIVTAEM
jgi:ABC-type nitrate/sulfonate/bicarbonate transport system permease component